MSAGLFKNRVRTRSSALVLQDDELLLVNQQVPTRTHPIWLPPGGEVQFGETLQDAAAREVEEETGLLVTIKNLAAVHEFIEPPFHAVEFYFFAVVTGGDLKPGTDPELSFNDQQIIKTEFIDRNRLSQLPVFPGFIKQKASTLLSGYAHLPLHIVSDQR